VLSHPLGGFYGAAVMLAVAISDLFATPSRIRLRVLGSYGIGWLAIFLWWRQFFRQAAINQPHGWVPVPSLEGLLTQLLRQSMVYPLLLFLALCWLISMVSARVRTSSPFQLSPPQRVQFLIALGLISIAPLFWVISRLLPSNSIFLPRYLTGTTIGWTILLAHLVTYITEHNPLRSPMLLKAIALLSISVAFMPLCAPWVAKLAGKSPPDYLAFLAGTSDRAFGHVGLPIVCPDPQDFLARTHYAPDASRYYYLLNWDAATAPESLPDAAVIYHLLSAVKRHYAKFINIVGASEFLRQNPTFLVLDVPQRRWCFLNIKMGAYKIRPLMADPPIHYDHDGERALLLVERRP
jgi:hypothetical protein